MARGGGDPGSDRAKRVARLKRELVLQLFLKQGQFWCAVRKARERCGIQGRTGTPPGGQHLRAVFAMENLGWSELGEKVRFNILREVPKLEERMVPDSLRDGFLEREWGDFLTACVVYDPPADKLVEFAEYGGPTWISPSRAQIEEEEPQKRHAAVPVCIVRDPDQTEIKRVVHMMKILDEIHKSHPEIDVWNLVEEKGLFERFRSEMEDIPRRFHIEVREDTTAKDVADAYSLVREFQKEQNQRGGAPPREPLIAVQCAILYDRHNFADPADKRRRQWTHAKLAERFGLKSGRAAKAYVELGRTILRETRVQ